MPKRSSQLQKRVSSLERSSRPEVKHNVAESGGFDTVGSVAGTLLTPQLLAQGTGRNQRIGDKVKTRNIRFQCIIKMPSTPTNPTCAVRLLVLRSKKSNAVAGDMPTWYGSVDEDKFFVIKDILTQVSARGGEGYTGTGSTLKKIKFNVSTGLRKLQYDGGASMSPLNNEYLIYMFAENQSAEVAYNWQHYYIDN